MAAQALANQVNDPTAPLTLVQFRRRGAATFRGPTPGNVFQIEPVLPIFSSRFLPVADPS